MGSIPFGQFHIKLISSKCINSNSVFFSDSFFCLILFTMNRYSEYLFGIPTLSSLYSKWNCHGRKLNGKLISGFGYFVENVFNSNSIFFK